MLEQVASERAEVAVGARTEEGFSCPFSGTVARIYDRPARYPLPFLNGPRTRSTEKMILLSTSIYKKLVRYRMSVIGDNSV